MTLCVLLLHLLWHLPALNLNGTEILQHASLTSYHSYLQTQTSPMFTCCLQDKVHFHSTNSSAQQHRRSSSCSTNDKLPWAFLIYRLLLWKTLFLFNTWSENSIEQLAAVLLFRQFFHYKSFSTCQERKCYLLFFFLVQPHFKDTEEKLNQTSVFCFLWLTAAQVLVRSVVPNILENLSRLFCGFCLCLFVKSQTGCRMWRAGLCGGYAICCRTPRSSCVWTDFFMLLAVCLCSVLCCMNLGNYKPSPVYIQDGYDRKPDAVWTFGLLLPPVLMRTRNYLSLNCVFYVWW